MKQDRALVMCLYVDVRGEVERHGDVVQPRANEDVFDHHGVANGGAPSPRAMGAAARPPPRQTPLLAPTSDKERPHTNPPPTLSPVFLDILHTAGDWTRQTTS